MNPDLPMSKKIETYANEKLTFYLHKNRNFIHKLESTLKEREKEKKQKEEIEREIKKIETIKEEQRKYRMSKLIDQVQLRRLVQKQKSNSIEEEQEEEG